MDFDDLVQAMPWAPESINRLGLGLWAECGVILLVIAVLVFAYRAAMLQLVILPGARRSADAGYDRRSAKRTLSSQINIPRIEASRLLLLLGTALGCIHTVDGKTMLWYLSHAGLSTPDVVSPTWWLTFALLGLALAAATACFLSVARVAGWKGVTAGSPFLAAILGACLYLGFLAGPAGLLALIVARGEWSAKSILSLAWDRMVFAAQDGIADVRDAIVSKRYS